ncbi:transposase, partial [Weissella paramesenteroides]
MPGSCWAESDFFFETTVIQLYTKGITTAEIAELIEKMYGAHY